MPYYTVADIDCCVLIIRRARSRNRRFRLASRASWLLLRRSIMSAVPSHLLMAINGDNDIINSFLKPIRPHPCRPARPSRAPVHTVVRIRMRRAINLADSEQCFQWKLRRVLNNEAPLVVGASLAQAHHWRYITGAPI